MSKWDSLTCMLLKNIHLRSLLPIQLFWSFSCFIFVIYFDACCYSDASGSCCVTASQMIVCQHMCVCVCMCVVIRPVRCWLVSDRAAVVHCVCWAVHSCLSMIATQPLLMLLSCWKMPDSHSLQALHLREYQRLASHHLHLQV